MAGELIDIDTLVPIPSFADIATAASPVTQGIPEADWNVTAFGAVKIWSNVAVDDAQKSSIGAIWHENITSGSISTRTAIRGLRLAMSLKSTNPANVVFLIASQIRDPGDAEAIPNTDDFGETPFTLRAANQSLTPVALPINISDPETMKRTSYCFLAAYLMRLIVKAPESVVSGLPNMKLRFKSFYGPSRLVARFNLSRAQASAYREALLSQSLIALTYTHALAYTHQNIIYHELDAKDVEVLSYLGFVPFSYTGMHAYTLMMEIKEFTQVSLDKLLTLFYANITAPALNKIAQIEREYERTSAHPTRDITFRYCTLWGPQYFASVRSKNCPHLLYTVVHAWKALLAAGHPNADPERIVAVNILSDGMKKDSQESGRNHRRIFETKYATEEGSMKIILAGGFGVSFKNLSIKNFLFQFDTISILRSYILLLIL